MNLPQYKTNPDEDLHSFSFISEGKNGKIEKVIRYEKITDDVFIVKKKWFANLSNGN